MAAGAHDATLKFDAENFEVITVNLDGQPVNVRKYTTVYVGKPIEMAAVQPPRGVGPSGAPPSTEGTPLADPFAYQTMNIYVPETAAEDGKTAILLQVRNSGWYAAGPAEVVEAGKDYVSTSDTDATGAALKAGYIIVNAGSRSRGAEAADSTLVGKAPAAVVDAKAAVRYLRLNDATMPGSAERIIITGTSGGGALSVAVAASGNSAEYYPYLAEIGAAGMSKAGESFLNDDVFATLAYCPITDLGNADTAYEWQYGFLRSADNVVGGTLTDAHKAGSAKLAAAYDSYISSLGYKLEDGSPLTAETMKKAIVSHLTREVEEAIAEGATIPAIGEDFGVEGRDGSRSFANDWLTVEAEKVTDLNYENYLKFVSSVSALKIVPAFDATANTGNEYLRGENSLFGSSTDTYANFTEYGWNNNEVAGDGSGPDDTGKNWADYITGDGADLANQLKLINPHAFFNTEADTALYWYIRHGTLDRDTAFAVELALYYGVLSDESVQDVNFELAWMKPHAGNYDVQEAFAWLAETLAAAGEP
nr:subtype B tannase [Devosia sp. 919]